MPSRVSKGFSLCTAVIGVLCVVTGFGIAVCAWVLNSKLPPGFHYQDKEKHYDTISIGSYWWGGMIYVLPGVIGIIAGCTRSVVAMVFYLIFNLICCICSLVVVVMCGLVLLVWVIVDEMLQGGKCHTAMMNPPSCVCMTLEGGQFTLFGATCPVFMNIQVVIGAMVTMATLSSLLSFIASYVSCCALCNQESTDVGGIIISGGAGVYQPPPIVVSNMEGGNAVGYPPPAYNPQYIPQPGYNPQYAPQPGYNPQYAAQGGYNPPMGGAGLHNDSAHGDGMPYATSDKANLVGNEYH